MSNEAKMYIATVIAVGGTVMLFYPASLHLTWGQLFWLLVMLYANRFQVAYSERFRHERRAALR